MRNLTPGGAASAVVLLAVLTACGGGSGGSSAGAPTDAARSDFCGQVVKLAAVRDGKGARAWATALEKVGTPKGISGSQREGFDLVIADAEKLPADATAADLLKQKKLTLAEQAKLVNFLGYAQKTCPDEFKAAVASASPAS